MTLIRPRLSRDAASLLILTFALSSCDTGPPRRPASKVKPGPSLKPAPRASSLKPGSEPIQRPSSAAHNSKSAAAAVTAPIAPVTAEPEPLTKPDQARIELAPWRKGPRLRALPFSGRTQPGEQAYEIRMLDHRLGHACRPSIESVRLRDDGVTEVRLAVRRTPSTMMQSPFSVILIVSGECELQIVQLGVHELGAAIPEAPLSGFKTERAGIATLRYREPIVVRPLAACRP